MCAWQDLVDQHLRDLKQTPVMQSAIGGKFTQQIICRSVDYKSEKDEDFYQVSLDVRGKKNLEVRLKLLPIALLQLISIYGASLCLQSYCFACI